MKAGRFFSVILAACIFFTQCGPSDHTVGSPGPRDTLLVDSRKSGAARSPGIVSRIRASKTFLIQPLRYLKCRIRRDRLDTNGIIVLAYHNVLPVEKTEDLYVVSLRNFKDQLAWLNRFFRIISVEEMDTHTNSEKPVVIITFDDGKTNNYHHAFPALREQGVPAVFFVITDMVGTGDYADWEQLKRMQKNGMSICSHSCTHPDFGALSEEDAWYQLSRSAAMLQEMVPDAPRLFAYPMGNARNMKDTDRALLDSAGYAYSFAFGGGAFSEIRDRHRIPRYMTVDIQGVTLVEQILDEFEKLK